MTPGNGFGGSGVWWVEQDGANAEEMGVWAKRRDREEGKKLVTDPGIGYGAHNTVRVARPMESART